LLYGLIAQAIGKSIHLFGRRANHPRELRGIAIEFLCRAVYRPRNMAHHVSTTTDLPVEKLFNLLCDSGRCGGQLGFV
jgi:hypothetical protein